MSTTPLTTEAIREMRAAITPGPWRNEGQVVVDENSVVVGNEAYEWRFVGHFNSDTDDDAGLTTLPISVEAARANAEFCAAAPEIVDYLLAEVERLRKELNGIIE